jgi:adenylate kinase
MVIIIMGPQGSGKTTQAVMLSEYFNIPHLESGEVFREIALLDSELGRRIKKALDAGHLVDPADADAVIETMFDKAKYHNHVIVDGFPRDLEQAKRHRGKIDRVYNLEVGKEECVRRLLLRGRTDDKPGIIEERLRIYHERTLPVLELFDQLSILERINGERSPEVIFEDIRDRITRMLQIGDAELMQ